MLDLLEAVSKDGADVKPADLNKAIAQVKKKGRLCRITGGPVSPCGACMPRHRAAAPSAFERAACVPTAAPCTAHHRFLQAAKESSSVLNYELVVPGVDARTGLFTAVSGA